jgi:hypothetical protein
MSRLNVNPLVVVLTVSIVLMLGVSPAQAQQRYLAPRAVVDVLRSEGNYVSYSGQQCLRWETGGVALSRVEPGLGYAAKYYLSSTTNGTIARDGVYDECVAFVRMATGAPGSAYWKKGPPGIFPNGLKNNLTVGTLLATFDSSGRYSGHCVVFAGWRSDGGLSVWDQNVAGRTIKWRAIPSTGRGGVLDAKSYFVVVTN